MCGLNDYVLKFMKEYNIDEELYVVEDVTDEYGYGYPIGGMNQETNKVETDFDGFMWLHEILN